MLERLHRQALEPPSPPQSHPLPAPLPSSNAADAHHVSGGFPGGKPPQGSPRPACTASNSETMVDAAMYARDKEGDSGQGKHGQQDQQASAHEAALSQASSAPEVVQTWWGGCAKSLEGEPLEWMLLMPQGPKSQTFKP